MVQKKKKVKKNNDYGIILPIGVPSHICGVLINKKIDILFDKYAFGVPLSELNLSHKLYVLDIALRNITHVYKSDLTVGANMIDVPLMYGPTRNHHLIQKYFGEKTRETNMGNHDIDKDVLDTMSNMLTKSQIHKENDDMITKNNSVSDDVHEDVEDDTVVAHGVIVNNYDEKRKFASKGKKDHAVKDVDKNVETLCEDVVSNDEGIFLRCDVNSKVYRLFTTGTQSINYVLIYMTPHKDEGFNLICLDVEQVIADKSEDTMLSTEDDISFYDAETFNLNKGDDGIYFPFYD